MKKVLFFFFTCYLLLVTFAHAQILTCAVVLKATPPGPFPCSVTATWQDNSDNESGFLLQRRLNGGTWTTIGGGPLAVNITSAVDATLQQSTTVDNVYDYQVIAMNSAGQSLPSNVASFTIPKAAAVPKPATSLTITFQDATGQIKLTGGKTINLKNQSGSMSLTAAAITIVNIE